MLTVDHHWKGDAPADGGVWHHYPEGRSDYSGPKHGPVERTEVVTQLIVDGVTLSTARTHSLKCQECGARS